MGVLRGAGGLAVLLCACAPPTQLVVVCDTDLEPMVEVRAIEVAVSRPTFFFLDRHVFELDETSLPFTLAVVPAYRDDEPVRITATALAPDGHAIVHFLAETAFVPGEGRVIEAPLARSCMNEPPCWDDGLACVMGECVPTAVDARALPRSGGSIDPLFEERIAPDAGVPDAGVCVDGASCSTGNPCEVAELACGPEPSCTVVSTLMPGAECGNGRVCNAEGRCVLR